MEGMEAGTGGVGILLESGRGCDAARRSMYYIANKHGSGAMAKK